jgi:hypothetical protein
MQGRALLKLRILVAPPKTQGVLVRGHAGLVINKLSLSGAGATQATHGDWEWGGGGRGAETDGLLLHLWAGVQEPLAAARSPGLTVTFP